MDPVEILQFIGIPVAVATGIMVLSWGLFSSKRLQPLGATIAVGVSCIVAFALQEGIPDIPPAEQWHWLVITVVVVSLLACIYPLFKRWDELIVLQAMIAGIVGAGIMQFPEQSQLLERFSVFLMVLFVSVGLRRLTIPPWHMYVATWWILAGFSILALQSSFAKLSFFAGAMSAVAAALCVLQLMKPRETKSVQMIFGVLIVGCSLCGLAYDQGGPLHQTVWLIPLIGIPISAVAYFVCKRKYRAKVSLAILLTFVSGALIWSIFTTPAADSMWP